MHDATKSGCIHAGKVRVRFTGMENTYMLHLAQLDEGFEAEEVPAPLEGYLDVTYDK